MIDRLIVVGKALKPIGLKGELKVYPYTENPDIFKDFPFLFFEEERYEVAKTRIHQNLVVVSLKNVQTFEGAKNLTGKIVKTSSRFFPPPEEDEFFWYELIGLSVFDTQGSRLGEVKSLMRTSAHDVLEIQTDKKELLIPFIDEIVKSIDVEQSQIIIDLLDGMSPDD
jgi:16S rRNA processing protein RimM